MVANNFNFDQIDRVVVASFREREVTGPMIAELVEALSDKMRFDGVGLFVLDMTGVEFIASACVGPLVRFLQELEHIRGKVALANCAPNVQFLFKVTKLDTILPLYDDREEACRELVGA